MICNRLHSVVAFDWSLVDLPWLCCWLLDWLLVDSLDVSVALGQMKDTSKVSILNSVLVPF